MLRRFLLGLVLGLVVGGLVAVGVIAGLGIRVFVGTGGAILAYLAAAVTGVLIGLVAGKPIWASGAKVEAGLKALFGAVIGTGIMFALRQWGGSWVLDIPAVGIDGATAVGNLPVVSIPLLAALLGGFFELDNTGQNEGDGKGRGAARERRRVAADGPATAKARVERRGDVADPDVHDDASDAVSRRAKR